MPTALTEDYRRGQTTLRQQLLGWLDAFVHLADRAADLPVLRASAVDLAGALRVRWATVPELPLYPAYRSVSGRRRTARVTGGRDRHIEG